MAVSGALPKISVEMPDTVNLGFLGPLSGSVESWGLPGLHGCRIWEDWLNNAGGILIAGRRYPVKIWAYDCKYDPELAVAGAKHLVQTRNIKLLMSLGGDILTPVIDYLTSNKILTTTLLPSDLSPDTPFLLAPSEQHPICNVTGVEWLARTFPEKRTVALCSQTDALGLPSLATYRAAFKAAGISIVKEVQYDPNCDLPATVVDPMLSESPDILCWCTSYAPMVHKMTEYAFSRGYRGQLISCTLDNYERLVERTDQRFMDGFIFQFPDFDDPLLAEKAFFFNQPETFYKQYNERFPDEWSAVSWEYASILDIWHAAVERAGDVNSGAVLAAMKQSGHVTHAFGPARWWGEDIFGIDNALVGDWPVVVLTGGKARIVEFSSIPTWLERHRDLLRVELSALNQLWSQRLKDKASRTTLMNRNFLRVAK